MAIILANADGTSYHRYGGRTSISPMNMDGLVEIMQKGLLTHNKYMLNQAPPKPKKRLELRQLINDELSTKIKPTFGCFHCHFAREAKQYLALEARTWRPNQFWIWPLPKRLGIVLNQKRQYQIDSVIIGSSAYLAGIKEGDLLQTLAGKKVLSKYDVQWILEKSPPEKISLSYSLLRNGELIKGTFQLENAWKVGDVAEYKWRVDNVFTRHMMKFLPTPGFMGTKLLPHQLKALKLPESRFAIKVTHLSYGTYLAGIRGGDIIIAAANKSNFKSMRDFYHWCELKRLDDEDIKMELIRQGLEMKVVINLSYLNYNKIEKAPQVMLGFTAQQLPGNILRVGNVIDDSNAEKTGLSLGDRIFSIEGKKVGTYDKLKMLLKHKSPGDLLTLKVTRNKKLLQFAYVLTSKERKSSNLAKLTNKVTKIGQKIKCIVTIKLPEDKHIYSMHKEGFGIPTNLEFRGRGYKLVGATEEPTPEKLEDAAGVMWVLYDTIQLIQTIEITDPNKFHLSLSVYAQVCDSDGCHEFRAILENSGKEDFSEFRGHFEQQLEISKE